jgi:glucose-6-phosphate dehydrogenase assembly protein OpcA
MSAPVLPPVVVTPSVPLGDIERELSRQLKALQGPGEEPFLRARMSNLVIYCNSAALAERLTEAVPDVVTVHPARVLLMVAEPDAPPHGVTASVIVRHQRLGNDQQSCTEQVTLHAGGTSVNDLPFAVRSLLVGDLPTNLWWAAPVPPPLAGPLLYELTEQSQQIMYDSIGWPDPARGVVAVGTWLEEIERGERGGRWQVASDLNWRRLKYWRRLLAQALDPASTPGAIESITEAVVEHGPHAVIQAWELVSWASRRLDWQVLTGRVQPGVEISWRFLAAHGELRVRIRRLEEGPPEIRKIRIACKLDGKPGALNVIVDGANRLAVVPEGVEGARRTMTVPPQTATELVGRQLSDREPDPVFYESMAVAQSLARSVLR